MAAVVCALGAGCDGGWGKGRAAKGEGGREEVRAAPLAVQQVRAYPETVTGLFVSLADFETVAGTVGEKGFEQVESFRITPAAGGERRLVVNVTRTGAGAMQVRLARGAALVFDMPGVYDFSGYSLLSLAVHSRTLRDDLRITLTTDGASWRSHRTLLKPGWNNVLVDIQRLKYVRGFDLAGVRTMRMEFPDAGGAVRFNLDDVLLVNNRRMLTGAPDGVEIYKSGLDYTIRLRGRRTPVSLSQSPDGLWRGMALQPSVRLAGPDGNASGEGESLELMGARRVGAVDVLEHNAIRVRIANVWYFPTRAGEWASLDGVRRIRWEYTFYGDGRWVAHVELNNAGGREISSVRIGWARGGRTEQGVFRDHGAVVVPAASARRAGSRAWRELHPARPVGADDCGRGGLRARRRRQGRVRRISGMLLSQGPQGPLPVQHCPAAGGS